MGRVGVAPTTLPVDFRAPPLVGPAAHYTPIYMRNTLSCCLGYPAYAITLTYVGNTDLVVVAVTD